jgi:hypothetical protein
MYRNIESALDRLAAGATAFFTGGLQLGEFGGGGGVDGGGVDGGGVDGGGVDGGGVDGGGVDGGGIVTSVLH